MVFDAGGYLGRHITKTSAKGIFAEVDLPCGRGVAG